MASSTAQDDRRFADRRWSYLWLSLAAAATLAGIEWNIAALLAVTSVFLIRFIRDRPFWSGLMLGIGVMTLAGGLAYRGTALIVFGSYRNYGLMVFSVTAALYLPLMADRLLGVRIGGFLGTLVFPLARVTLECVGAALGPFGTWGSLAALASSWTVPAQMVSITGMCGLSFLIGWFATLVNWAWEERFNWRRLRSGLLAYAAVLTVVLAGGAVRLALFPPAGATVRVAAITLADDVASRQLAAAYLNTAFCAGVIDPRELDQLRAANRTTQDYLLDQADVAARGGAKIICWAEQNASVLEPDEMAFFDRARELARRRHVYLLMGLDTLCCRQSSPVENKIVAVTPDGQIAWQYFKSHPVAAEEEQIACGDGRMPTLDTPYGRLGGAICYDTDFVDFVRLAGIQGVDILFAPSFDWRAIADTRARVTAFRPLESGASLVRPTSQGISLIVDYQGRMLGRRDYYADNDHILLADVPTQGVRTFYSQFGDLFAWLAAAGLLGLAVWSMRQGSAGVRVVAPSCNHALAGGQ